MTRLCLPAILIILWSSAIQADEVQFFETRIRPILVKHCYKCHSSAAAKVQGGLTVDSREGLRQGGESGPAIMPGNPAKSLLLQALKHESVEMPPAGKLPARVIADFAQWIRRGAIDPRAKASVAASARAVWQAEMKQRSRWWSLQPLRDVSPPAVGNGGPVDRFVRASLAKAGLSPAPPASATILLRRLSFVLTGLPPSAEQVAAFPAAYAKNPEQALARLTDELLASPQFGERFARHWMDVVRYTDTYGYEWDNPAKGSWEYRDYLTRSFNSDIPFDRMIREQIAGDLLPEPRINPRAQVNESLIGPMFYHLGEHRHGASLDFNGIHQDMVNNKIDAFSKTFLAMTVACARCHDHKLDAISQADYYALAGVFMSPRWTCRVIDTPGKYENEIQQLKKLRGQVRQQLANRWQVDRQQLSGRLSQWTNTHRSALQKTRIEDLTHPLATVAGATDANIGQVSSKLRRTWQETRKARIQANAKSYRVLSDFRQPGLPAGWTTEGSGIQHGYVRHGTPRVSLSGDTLIDELLPRGYHTAALSSKLPGALRLPAQEAIPGKHVSLKLRGGEWSGYLTVPQNAFQTEAVKFLQPANGWISISDRGLKNGVTRLFSEVATSSLNPNFPPRTGLANVAQTHLPDNDEGFDKRSSFQLTGIVTHDAAGAPADTLDAFVPLYDQAAAPASLADERQRLFAWYAQAIERWATDEATAGDVALLNWLLKEELITNQTSQAGEIATLVQAYRRWEARLDFPRSVNSMDERDVRPLNYRLNIRGDVDRDGPLIPRNFLAVFPDRHGVKQSKSSGRLELARFLGSPRHPQTARVYVNRVWQWIFGRGIVATPNDFGHLGDRPAHPELLDWLTRRFMTEGWSTKKLIRRLVLSESFRQSGTVSPAAAEQDPENRLLHHYSTRRLEAEAIRDSLLAVSGRLDRRLFGRPINPPRSVEDGAKRLFSGPLDSHGRRSLYLKMSIMDPPKFLVCFNLPDLKLPTGRRDVTNVPAQALALLNDPLVIQLADCWAEQLINDKRAEPQQRVAAMFVQALGRPPREQELQRWTKAVNDFSLQQPFLSSRPGPANIKGRSLEKDVHSSFAQSGNLMDDKTAWAELAHAFFNTKEFIYYR